VVDLGELGDLGGHVGVRARDVYVVDTIWLTQFYFLFFVEVGSRLAERIEREAVPL
jgi:hypothetical protein